MTVQAAGVGPAQYLVMPTLVQLGGNGGGAPQALEPPITPLRRLGQALLAQWNQPATMITFGHVAFVPVPGGLAIRLDRTGLPLEARFDGIPNVQPTKREIAFRAFKRELVVPLDQLQALVTFGRLPGEVVEAVIQSSPVFTDYKIHTAYNVKDEQFRPAHTIGLSLAHLDPEQQHLNTYTNPYFQPEQSETSRIPLVQGTDEGLEIWLPVGMSLDYIDRLATTFRLHPIPEQYVKTFDLPGAVQREIHYGTVFRIKRDGIDDFLRLMGFNDTTNVRKLAPNLTPMVNEVKKHLEALRQYHNYQPVIVQDDPIRTIEHSLSQLLRQSSPHRVTPFVTLHPLQGLIIRLPENQGPENYVNRLIRFLGFDSRPITYQKEGMNYVNEIVVPIDQMESFLRHPMHLDQLAATLPRDLVTWRDKISVLWGERENVPSTAGTVRTETRVANTMSRRLYGLGSPEAADQLRGYTAVGQPENVLHLPRVVFQPGKMTVYFPKIMTPSTTSEGLLRTGMAYFGYVPALVEDVEATNRFRVRMGDLLGVEVVKCNQTFPDNPHQVYSSHVDLPFGDILPFLERTLGMRDLPPHTAIRFERETCWNEVLFGFGGQLGVGLLPHGRVNPEGLKLLPPRITLPDPLPNYSPLEMGRVFEQILDDGGVGQPMRYSQKLIALLQDLGPDPLARTKRTLLTAFRHFTYELSQVPPKVPLEVKVQSIISIAETAEYCYPGTQVRVVEETKRVAGHGEDARFIIAGFWEEYKNSALHEVFTNYPQGVHAFALAQDEWSEEFGLDHLSGRMDPARVANGRPALTEANRLAFRAICTDHVRAIRALTDKCNGRRDAHGAVQNVAQYESLLRQILSRRGFDGVGVEQEIERLLPVEPTTFAVSVSEEAMKLLMIGVGILNR